MPEQIVRTLRDADAILNAGKDLGSFRKGILSAMEVSDSTYDRWRKQYGGKKSEEAKRLKELEKENERLKQLVGEQALDIKMLKHITDGNG